MAEIETEKKATAWPALPWERVGGYGEYAAYVDADCGEDAAGADSAAEPLVECAAVCDGAGAGDFGDGLRGRCAGY